MKKISSLLLILGMLFSVVSCTNEPGPGEKDDEDNNNKFESIDAPDHNVIVAYVTSWSSGKPDPNLITHINYAFGDVNKTFNGITINNPARLREMASLKKQNPQLKVLLSIGGWGSGGFSEMAANKTNRQAFAADCAKIIKDYGIDGIDIDWEYPGSSVAGISSSSSDMSNFTLLMRDIRSAIGRDNLLTIATIASAKFISFRDVMPYLNYVNIMSYDLGEAPLHHSALYKSKNTPSQTCDSSVKAHLAAGIPAGKLVMGMPFYGRGKAGTAAVNYKSIVIPDDCSVYFDEEAMVPFIADADGALIFGFDNPSSLTAKCKYIMDNGLLGAMYWEFGGDNDKKELATAVYNGIFGLK